MSKGCIHEQPLNDDREQNKVKFNSKKTTNSKQTNNNKRTTI
jgi:hypothetical protein